MADPGKPRPLPSADLLVQSLLALVRALLLGAHVHVHEALRQLPFVCAVTGVPEAVGRGLESDGALHPR